VEFLELLKLTGIGAGGAALAVAFLFIRGGCRRDGHADHEQPAAGNRWGFDVKAWPLSWLFKRHREQVEHSRDVRHALAGEQQNLACRVDVALAQLVALEKQLYGHGRSGVGHPDRPKRADDRVDAGRDDRSEA
jgi:hypothetical protein